MRAIRVYATRARNLNLYSGTPLGFCSVEQYFGRRSRGGRDPGPSRKNCYLGLETLFLALAHPYVAFCSVEKKKQDVGNRSECGCPTGPTRNESRKTLALPPLHPGMAIAEGGAKDVPFGTRGGRTGLIRGGCSEPFQTLFFGKKTKKKYIK